MDTRFNLSQKQAVAIFNGKDPWSRTQKLRDDNIVHQVDIEIDGMPVAVVVFRSGKMGTQDLYNIGCAFVADDEGKPVYREAVQTVGSPDLQAVIQTATKLSADSEKVINLFT